MSISVQTMTTYFQYLDSLRRSGRTNMFGAGPFLRAEFSALDQKTSYAVLKAWMDLDLSIPVADRAEKAVATLKDRRP